MHDHIGFIGLGRMGAPMAANLLAAGYSIAVWNRTAEKSAELEAKGAARVARPADLAHPDGMVLSMVADDAALESVVFGDDGILDALGAGGVHISLSTVAPHTARRLTAAHAERGAHYLAAPVFGRPDAAAARRLWIALAGAPAARERAQPVLQALGQAIYEFGDDPAAANVAKLAGNFLIVAAMEAMAEAFTLAGKHGLDRGAFARMMADTLFAGPIYRNYGAMIAAGAYTPAGFRLALGHKDVGLVLDTAREVNMPMPLASLVRDRLTAALARGRGDEDWAALARGVAEDAGLPA